jgi:hypothetical protein
MAIVYARRFACTAALFALACSAHALDSSEGLAKKFSKPIASLIGVPFPFNYYHGYGPNNGNSKTLNIQPVIPFSLNEDRNVISPTIDPVIWQNDIARRSGSQFGLIK